MIQIEIAIIKWFFGGKWHSNPTDQSNQCERPLDDIEPGFDQTEIDSF